MDMTVPRRTERAVLRLLTAADVDDLLAYRSRKDVCRYLTFAPMGREDVEGLVEEWGDSATLAGDHDGIVLAVEHEGRVVGDLKLGLGLLENAQGEIGWVFHPDVRGQGLVLGLEIVEDKKSKTPAPELTRRIVEECWQRGLVPVSFEALMRANGVVRTRRDGTRVLYEISNPKLIQAFDLITEVMQESIEERSRGARSA